MKKKKNESPRYVYILTEEGYPRKAYVNRKRAEKLAEEMNKNPITNDNFWLVIALPLKGRIKT